ncbi:MAG: hypothetical protein ABIO92_08800 [Chloroflexia bacterium]
MKILPYKVLMAFITCLLLGGCVSGDTVQQAGEVDSGCWAEVLAPVLGDLDVQIGGIAAVSGDDIWAVGQQTNTEGGSRTVTMHWGGERWAAVPSPNVSEGGESKNQLYAVAASAANEVWAVGAYTEGTGNFRNLAMRWNGQAWELRLPPSPGLLENGLNGVGLIDGFEVWAVGTALSDEGKDPQMVIFRWDGSAWAQSKSPEHSSHNLLAVKALSKNDVWAAGTDVIRWDGREWQQVPTPVDHPGGYLDGVAATGPNDVWVTGNDGNEAIAVHWDGARWSGGNTPKLGDGPFPHDIASLAPDDIWIAGEYSDDPAYSLPMLLRWDGQEWHAIANPIPGRAARLQSLTVADGVLWAAGTQQDATGTRPLLLRRTAGPCADAEDG